MEGDHHQPPAGFENPLRRRQTLHELLKLAVDENAQRLKGARGRMRAPRPLAPQNLFHHPHKIARGGKGLFFSGLHDRPRQRPRLSLLAIGEKNVGKRLFRKRVDHLRRRHAGLLHAHVQRPFVQEGKAARRIIKLHGRNPDIEQHAVRLLPKAGFGQRPFHLRIAPVIHMHPAGMGRGQLLRQRHRIRIAVDGHKPCFRHGENGARMPAGAKGAINIDPARAHIQRLQGLFMQNRHMPHFRPAAGGGLIRGRCRPFLHGHLEKPFPSAAGASQARNPHTRRRKHPSGQSWLMPGKDVFESASLNKWLPWRFDARHFGKESQDHCAFPAKTDHEKSKEKRQPACKPGSVPPARKKEPAAMAIHLGRALLHASRDQPGQRGRKHALHPPDRWRARAVPIRSCSGRGLPCRPCRQGRGALLPHPFTLTPRRTQACGCIIPLAAMRTDRRGAVCFLWRFP